MPSELRMITKCIFIMVSSIISVIFIIDSSLVNGQKLSWSTGTPMPTNRTEISSGIIDGKILVLGGADYQKDGITDVVEIYDPETNQWNRSASLPVPIDHTAVVTYEGKLYIVGGFLEDKTPTDRLMIYDPAVDEWTEGASLPSARGALSAEVVDGNIYAISGVNSTHDPVTTNEVYNIENNTWTAVEPLNKPKHHVASAVIDGKIYVLGGRLLGNG